METSLTNELIREVYPIDAHEECYVDIHRETGRVMWFGKESNDRRSEIDKHNVANKCKDWATTKGYILFSKTRLNSSLASCYFDTMGIHDYEDDFHNDFRAETEPDAIFKACEWIRKKLKGTINGTQ